MGRVETEESGDRGSKIQASGPVKCVGAVKQRASVCLQHARLCRSSFSFRWCCTFKSCLNQARTPLLSLHSLYPPSHPSLPPNLSHLPASCPSVSSLATPSYEKERKLETNSSL